VEGQRKKTSNIATTKAARGECVQNVKISKCENIVKEPR
jgi:hypothetical protein